MASDGLLYGISMLRSESNLPRRWKHVGGSQHADKVNPLESNDINFATAMPTIMTFPIGEWICDGVVHGD
ncbi:hypothetical protein H9L39_11966 [Fusarium oxysporum f. sp. albedinis]|nr:hypothetical protein H9L39_11966 [Fusarium oxysporum f. sp. albedinis]